MKVAKILVTCFLCIFWTTKYSSAQYDFSLSTENGQMLYYQTLGNGDSVCVTHPEKEWPYFADNKPVGELTIPETVAFDGRIYRVVEIGSYAFYGCDSLTQVDMKSIRRIGTQTFCGCVLLEKISYNTGLQSIGEGAFAYCRSLEQVELGRDLEYLGISAFSMCTGLKKVTIHPDSERLLDSTIFNGCPLLKEAQKPKCHLQVWSFWCAQTIRE